MRLNELKNQNANLQQESDLEEIIQKFGIALCYRPQLQSMLRSGELSLDMSDNQLAYCINNMFRS